MALERDRRRQPHGVAVHVVAQHRDVGERDGPLGLEGVVGNLDGSKNLRERISGDISDANALGARLAEQMIEKGAGEVLEEVRREAVGA